MKFHKLLCAALCLVILTNCENDDPPYFFNAHPEIRVVTSPDSWDLTVQGPDTAVLYQGPRGGTHPSEVAWAEVFVWDKDSGVKQVIIEVEGNIDVNVNNTNQAFTEQIFAGLYESKHILEKKYNNNNNNNLNEKTLIDLFIKWRGLPAFGIVSPWYWHGKVTIRARDWGVPVGPEKETILQLVYNFNEGDVS